MSMSNALDLVFNLGFSLRRFVTSTPEVQSLGLASMHIRALRIIKKNEPCTANILAQKSGRDKAQITRLVNLLVEEGLIIREANPEDKRSQLLLLSQSGNQTYAQLQKVGEVATQIMYEGISVKDREDFERISKQIIENVSGATQSEKCNVKM